MQKAKPNFDRKLIRFLTAHVAFQSSEALLYDSLHTDRYLVFNLYFRATNTSIDRHLENALRQIFVDAFRLPVTVTNSFSLDASFAELGGTSVGVMKAITLIQKQLNVIISATTLFDNPSIRTLARTLTLILNGTAHPTGN